MLHPKPKKYTPLSRKNRWIRVIQGELKTNRKQQRDYDSDAYKWRHLIENYFAKIKEFRGIATRYDKTDCSYAASWNLVATLIASR